MDNADRRKEMTDTHLGISGVCIFLFSMDLVVFSTILCYTVISSREATTTCRSPRQKGATMNTIYRFSKDGKTYSANGNNRFEAQMNAELQWHVDLTGASYEEIYKLRIVRKGTV